MFRYPRTLGAHLVLFAAIAAGCASQRADDWPQAGQSLSHADRPSESPTDLSISPDMLPRLWLVAAPVNGEPPMLRNEGTRWVVSAPSLVYDGPSFQAMILQQKEVVFISRQIGMDGRREWRGPLALDTVRALAVIGTDSP